jgi:hypothetical protein
MALLKVTTSGDTFYLVDEEGQRFKRNKGATSQSGTGWADGEWNEYYNVTPIEVGISMMFGLNSPMGALQKTSAVTSIETIDSESDA